METIRDRLEELSFSQSKNYFNSGNIKECMEIMVQCMSSLTVSSDLENMQKLEKLLWKSLVYPIVKILRSKTDPASKTTKSASTKQRQSSDDDEDDNHIIEHRSRLRQRRPTNRSSSTSSSTSSSSRSSRSSRSSSPEPSSSVRIQNNHQNEPTRKVEFWSFLETCLGFYVRLYEVWQQENFPSSSVSNRKKVAHNLLMTIERKNAMQTLGIRIGDLARYLASEKDPFFQDVMPLDRDNAMELQKSRKLRMRNLSLKFYLNAYDWMPESGKPCLNIYSLSLSVVNPKRNVSYSQSIDCIFFLCMTFATRLDPVFAPGPGFDSKNNEQPKIMVKRLTTWEACKALFGESRDAFNTFLFQLICLIGNGIESQFGVCDISCLTEMCDCYDGFLALLESAATDNNQKSLFHLHRLLLILIVTCDVFKRIIITSSSSSSSSSLYSSKNDAVKADSLVGFCFGLVERFPNFDLISTLTLWLYHNWPLINCKFAASSDPLSLGLIHFLKNIVIPIIDNPKIVKESESGSINCVKLEQDQILVGLSAFEPYFRIGDISSKRARNLESVVKDRVYSLILLIAQDHSIEYVKFIRGKFEIEDPVAKKAQKEQFMRKLAHERLKEHVEGLEQKVKRWPQLKNTLKIFVPDVEMFLHQLNYIRRVIISQRIARIYVPRSVVHAIDIGKRKSEIAGAAREAIRFLETMVKQDDPIIEFQAIDVGGHEVVEQVVENGNYGDQESSRNSRNITMVSSQLASELGPDAFAEWKILWKYVGRLQQAFLSSCYEKQKSLSSSGSTGDVDKTLLVIVTDDENLTALAKRMNLDVISFADWQRNPM